MMHIRTTDDSGMSNGGLVVAITDSNGKSLREYNFTKVNDKTRKCRVSITPNTEYKILVKNNNAYRVAMNIEVDGTSITTSKLIIESFGFALLDSFMESHKKLMAVFASHEAVQDPTSKENGIIRVEIFKEKDFVAPPIVPVEHHHHHHHDYYHDRYLPHIWCQNVGTPTSSILRGSSLNADSEHCNYCSQVGAGGLSAGDVDLNLNESLATVEGSASDQRFVFDHTWRGIDSNPPYIFKFELQPISKCIEENAVVSAIMKQHGVCAEKAQDIFQQAVQNAISNKPHKRLRKKK